MTPRWYVLDASGNATLCTNEDHAQDMAARLFIAAPHRGPYIAAMLGDVAAARMEERERCAKELAYIGTRAESFAKRADDCGCLSRLILKALAAIRAG